MIQKFYQLYVECFDANNNVKICGREKCKELIKLANEIEPNIKHGNLEEGFMNVRAMINLHDKVILTLV